MIQQSVAISAQKVLPMACASANWTQFDCAPREQYSFAYDFYEDAKIVDICRDGLPWTFDSFDDRR